MGAKTMVRLDRLRSSEQRAHIVVCGPLDFGAHESFFAATRAISSGMDCTVDLVECPEITTPGLGLLINLRERVERDGGRLALENCGPQIVQLFWVTQQLERFGLPDIQRCPVDPECEEFSNEPTAACSACLEHGERPAERSRPARSERLPAASRKPEGGSGQSMASLLERTSELLVRVIDETRLGGHRDDGAIDDFLMARGLIERWRRRLGTGEWGVASDDLERDPSS